MLSEAVGQSKVILQRFFEIIVEVKAIALFLGNFEVMLRYDKRRHEA